MAYNYDYNPWDDSPASSNNNGQNLMQQQQAGDMNYGSYSASTGYNEQQPQVYGAQQQQDSYLYQNSDASGLDQSQQQPQGQEPQSKRAGNQGSLFRSLCGLVGCGPLADTLAAINLPFIDRLVQNVNRDLLISKLFYFFFYSAFGSLFPLMGVYFKQLGMNPGQVGILTGVRPFIEIFSAPFWHSWAERFQKSKALLLFSLLSWICFTYSLAIIKPPASACVAFNDTDYVLYTPYSANDLSNFEVNPGGPNSEEAQNQHEVASELISDKSLAAERESKDAILASEETPTDQGRRRRKRQADYSTNDNYGFQSPSGDSYFVGDLEKDFDDRLVGFERNELGSPIEGSDRRHSAMNRYKRNSDAREPDDLLGESDATEPEEVDENEIVSHNKNNNAKPRVEQSESGGQTDNYEERARNQPPASPSITTITTSTTTTTTPEPDSFTTQETKVNKSKKVFKQRHKTPPTHIVGMSPITVEYAVNYNKEKHSKFVTPMFSTIVYKLDDIKEVFFLLLLLISLGEFFSAPALTLADSATLSYLGENTDLYGRQRLFGSLSWAITLLLVGMALDNATSFADHPCGPHQRERSYTVCFMIFSLLMGCALLTATQFRFDYKKGVPTLVATADGNTTVTTIVDGSTNSTGGIDDLYASTQPRSIFNTAPPVNAPSNQQQQSKEKFEFLDKWKSAVFAQNTKELPEWVNVFRQFKNSLHLTYLFITWFLGCGVGLVFTFLFWHLQDVGGTPTLFGICSVINHISEIMAYFFSFGIIKRFGHTKVLSVGLGCNVIRFLYVAFLTNPYYALPFELVQGITHAACFAACCSYISHESKPELKTSTQGVMQGLHHGIGRACGALIGGYMIGAIGSRASFCIYGLLSGCVLAGFLYVRKRASEVEDSDIKVDESEALGGYGAPQGVPSAIPVQTNTTANVSAQGLDYQW